MLESYEENFWKKKQIGTSRFNWKLQRKLKNDILKYIDKNIIPNVYLPHLKELERKFVEVSGFKGDEEGKAGIQTSNANNEKCYNEIKAARHPSNEIMSFNVMSYGWGVTTSDVEKLRFTRDQRAIVFCHLSQIPSLKKILRTSTTA